MASVTTEFKMAEGRLILRCDSELFERLQELACREIGVFVPLTVPPTPVSAITIELVPGAKARPVGWVRNLAAMVLCLLLLFGPIGLVTAVRWLMSL
jgi:hypothetical protein